MIRKIESTRIHKVDSASVWWEDGERYGYAKPEKYAVGCIIGDCWIVDKNGRRHPGYNVSPVSMNGDMLQEVK